MQHSLKNAGCRVIAAVLPLHDFPMETLEPLVLLASVGNLEILKKRAT